MNVSSLHLPVPYLLGFLGFSAIKRIEPVYVPCCNGIMYVMPRNAEPAQMLQYVQHDPGQHSLHYFVIVDLSGLCL